MTVPSGMLQHFGDIFVRKSLHIHQQQYGSKGRRKYGQGVLHVLVHDARKPRLFCTRLVVPAPIYDEMIVEVEVFNVIELSGSGARRPPSGND